MLRIESSTLSVDVLPEVGGKIGQIRDKSSGRELLVPAQRSYLTIPLSGDWFQGDTSGMDDCFPNIAAGPYPCAPWAPTHLPELGEWTHGCWDVINGAGDRVVLERLGSSLPYFARKVVCFAEDRTLEFSYRIENRSEFPLRYMWAAHPLIAVQGDYELKLPPGDLAFRTFPYDGKDHAWPRLGVSDLSREWIAGGTTLKVFITGLTAGWCELCLQEYTLAFRFDLRTTPVVGVWFNNFGFPGGDAVPFRCVAVEPCTSQSDLLDELHAGAYPCLAARGSVEWSLRLEIRANRERLLRL
jgi:hypothetical protein